MIVRGHFCDLVGIEPGRGAAQDVSAFDRAAHPPFGHDRKHPSINEMGDVSVQAGR